MSTLCKLIARDGNTEYCIKFKCLCHGFDTDKDACPLWGEAIAAEKTAKAAKEYYEKMFYHRGSY